MREKMLDALFGEGGLLRVRAVLAFSLIGALIYLAIDGTVNPDIIETAAVAALAFYFGTRSK